ncbi:DUF3089 domain-containing protein [Nocardia harenae]|uniref:DUF3089 domain-containing protein n=1 Tax=Nocardia harenae TaxID=358707 RepID=UPI00083134C4|nr:DUF3089 domain-containing protein [Nocardia harenae]
MALVSLASPRRGVTTLLALLLALVAAAAGAVAMPEQPDEVRWLCRPDLPADPCRGDLATTVYRDGQPPEVVRPAAGQRGVDCFYVYPTVSTELAYSASKEIAAPLRFIAEQQAQRFSQVCDVYAPVYRQRTLLALRSPGSPEQARAAAELAFADVELAWEQYLADDNRGRGVVLIGHSQGTRMLRQLLRERIEPDPAVNARLVSAVLAGGNVVVPRGADVGGDFRTVPLCRERAQTHCALAWSLFGEAPPADSRYGVTPTTPEAAPQPYGPGYEVACVNPAAPGSTDEVALHTLVRTGTAPQALGTALPVPSTPWLRPTQRYRAQCAHVGGAHVLLARPEPGAPPLGPFPDPGWGLHVADLTLPLGDAVDTVAAQISAYQRH